MSNSVAILLMAFIVGVPILLMILFVICQLWKELNWESKIAEGLLTYGGLILAILLVLSLFYQTPKEYLEEPLYQVKGTVEAVYFEWNRGGNTCYQVYLNGEYYVLEDRWFYYKKFCDFNPDRWRKEAAGQTMELTITRSVDISLPGEGTIYGILDEAGNVLLDADVYRQFEYEELKKDAMTIPLWIGSSVLMVAAGLYIKFKLKW